MTDKTAPTAEKGIYDVGFGEVAFVGPYEFTRVPGGWLVITIRGMVFVPYHNEFDDEGEPMTAATQDCDLICEEISSFGNEFPVTTANIIDAAGRLRAAIASQASDIRKEAIERAAGINGADLYVTRSSILSLIDEKGNWK